MRLSPPITILAILAVAFAGLWANTKPTMDNDRTISCAIALDYFQRKIAEFRNQAFVVDYHEPSVTSTLIEASRNSAPPEMKNHPDFELGSGPINGIPKFIRV